MSILEEKVLPNTGGKERTCFDSSVSLESLISAKFCFRTISPSGSPTFVVRYYDDPETKTSLD